ASQIWMNRAALSAESLSRMPPRCIGWFATMPTLLPPMRAKQVMMLRANRGFTSKSSPRSTTARSSLYMSYGFRVDSGSTSSSDSSRRSIGSSQAASGGGSSQFDGRYERYLRTAARHAASSSNSPSPTPLTSL